MNSPSESKLAGENTNGQATQNCTVNTSILNQASNSNVLKQDSPQISGNSSSASRSNLIVNYLPQSVKEHDFNLLFSKIGPLKSCKLMFDRQTGYSFGYGFVEYVNDEDAKKAIDALNGYQIEHKRLKVAYARPNCEETKNTNLYIRNIPPTYDEHQLAELFGQYGEVVQVRLLRDQTTSFSRRIGFVIMGTKQMAQLAIAHLDNTVPPDAGNAEPIYVKYADEEGKKRHPPNNMFSNHHHNHHHSALTNLTGGGIGNHHQQQQQTHHSIHHHQRNQHHHHHRGFTDNNLMHQQHQQSHNFGGTGHPFSTALNNSGGSQFQQQSGYQNFSGLGNSQSAVSGVSSFGGFMMGGASSSSASNSLAHNLQTLGKMKSNRSSGASSSRYSYM